MKDDGIHRALAWAAANVALPPEPKRHDPADLLTGLLQAYWAGAVTQGAAAQMVGLRKETFAELADLRMIEAGLHRAAMRYYRLAFNRLFPECDPQARLEGTRARTAPATGATWSTPTARDCILLTPPQHRTLRELAPSMGQPDAEIADYLRTHRVPLYKRFPDLETGTESGVPEVKCM